jgi:hypothetical protein
MSAIVQFNWSRHCKKKVEPHLNNDLVRFSVELGMTLFDKTWTWDQGPHSIGRGDINGQRVTKNKLSWYQPWGRCHWIGFFAMAIGVLNYPELDWQFVSGSLHTVAVGRLNGEPKVVMDILNFKRMNAEESLELAERILPNRPELEGKGWEPLFAAFTGNVVPAIRETITEPFVNSCLAEAC